MQGRKIVLHTGRAKAYQLKVPGVLHDSVRHCKKCVQVRGRWVWKLPVYTKLTTHATPDGNSKTKAGTQIIDRAWGVMKSRLKEAPPP